MNVDVTADQPEPVAPALSSLVRRTARAHPDVAAPAELATLVLDAIPVGTERELLALLLPGYVASTLRRAESTPSADLDPERTWAGMLDERLPTSHGYAFLRDCTAEDLAAGAARRRSLAENLAARAAVFDVIATEVRDRNVRVAGELAATEVVGAVRAIRDPLVALSELTLPAIVARLEHSRSLLRTVVLAHADGTLDRQLTTALARPELRERWLDVLDAELRRPAQDSGRRRQTLSAVRDELLAPPVTAPDPRQAHGPLLLPQEASELTALLLSDHSVFELVAEQEATGRLHDDLTPVLFAADVLPAWIRALDAAHARLNALVAGQRAGVGVVAESLQAARVAVRARRAEAAAAYAAARVDAPRVWPRRTQTERQVLAEHDPEVRARLAALLTEHGVVLRSPVPALGRGLVAWAHREGLLEPASAHVTELLALDDAGFADVVTADALGTAPNPLLRNDHLLDHWRTSLIELKTALQQRLPGLVGQQRADAVRLGIGLDACLGESRRLELAMRTRIHPGDSETDELVQRLRWQAGSDVLALVEEGYLR